MSEVCNSEIIKHFPSAEAPITPYHNMAKLKKIALVRKPQEMF